MKIQNIKEDLTMKNFTNYLNMVELNEPCLKFLKAELEENYSLGLVRDLFSLPCLQYETRHKLAMVLALLEDGETDDTVVEWLAQILANIPTELWDEYNSRLGTFIEQGYYKLSRSQLLLLAHTLELMYAKGYGTLDLLKLMCQRISMSDREFNPDSDDNARVRLAKIAYGTSRFNLKDSLLAIKGMKRHFKKSGREYLLGMLNYYKGICLEASGTRIDYKDARYYIVKSKSREYELASVYLNYRGNNVETSKMC